MSTASQISKHPLRLNPFVFPSDTDSYFVLLVVSVIGVSLLIYNALYNTIPGVWEKSQVAQALCLEEAEAASLAQPENLSAGVDTFEQCMLSEDFTRAMFMLGGVLVLFIVAGLIYWAMPSWRIWRSKLEPISTDDDPTLVTYLANLCRNVGLSTPPTFVWDPLAPARHGLAFGHVGQYYVYLPGGFVDKFYNDEPAFRSELLHELSHLRNKDVDKTYFTIAIWWAFVIVALVPFVIGQPYAIGQLGKTWVSLFNQSWRLLALTILIYLIGSALLRSRELYADVRASVWDGPDGALRRSLESLSTAKGRWRDLLGFHPDPRERCELLENTDRLFRISFWSAFGTGIVAMIAYNGFKYWFSLLTPPSLLLDLLESFGTALIFAPLVVGVVGTGVWRTTFATLATEKSLFKAGHLGLAVGLGAILGQILSLTSSQFSAIDIIWYGLLLVSTYLFLLWVRVGASVWLDVAAVKSSPHLTYISGLMVATGLLIFWFTFLYASSPGVANGIFGLAYYVAFVTTPFTIMGFFVLWGYPLAAWFWRKQVAVSTGASWAYLDPPRPPLRWPKQGDIRLGLVLVVGLIGGIAFCVLSFIISLLLQFATDSDVLPFESFVYWVVRWQAVLAALIQAGAAAVIAFKVKRLGLLHALFAALIAACVMMVGAFGIYVLFSGHPFDYYVQSFPYGTILFLTAAIINGGTCLALLTVLGTSIVDRWLRRSKPSTA